MKKLKYIILFILLIHIIAIVAIGEVNEMKKNDRESYDNNVGEESNWISVSEIEISNVKEDRIGYLSFPTLKNTYYIKMPIKDSVELNVLATAIGHFDNTPYINGNVCFAAHNSGTNKKGQYVGYFDRIKDLKIGDEIIYEYLSKSYSYKVISNEIISEKDISVINDTKDNRLTLVTCVKGTQNRAYRRCVIARIND